MAPLRSWLSLFILFSLFQLVSPRSGWSIEEADRLWLVGEQAFGDRLYALSRSALERFVSGYPQDSRVPAATLMLARSRLALGAMEPALQAFRQAQRFSPPPGRPLEARFWEGETLFRMKRYQEARAAYGTILKEDASAPEAPDALYGIAWSEAELGRAGPAATAFRQFLEVWPQHPSAPAATVALAHALVDLKRHSDAAALLAPFATRYPGHPLAPDAAYLLGWSEIAAGKISEGIRDLRKFVAAHPKHDLASQARRAIVDALLRQGKKAELSQEYDALLKHSPPTAEDLYDAAIIAKRLGRNRDVEAVWKKLRSDFPGHALAARASLELAQAAFKKGQFKDTAALARAAAESEEPLVQVEGLLLIGESDLKLKRYQDALKAFRSAADVRGVEKSLHFRALAGRGLAHEELRQWAEAVRAYEAVSSESPDKALQNWAQERLKAVRARLSPSQPPASKNSSRS